MASQDSNFSLSNTPPTPKEEYALYNFNISDSLGKEYVDMFNDMSRFVIIQIAIQTLLMTVDPAAYSLFSADFLVLLLFIITGVLAYWLVFRKFISFS